MLFFKKKNKNLLITNVIIVNNISMMVGPTQVEPYEREVAGVMMSFMLNLGIFLGVHMAVLMLYLETGSTGFNL